LSTTAGRANAVELLWCDPSPKRHAIGHPTLVRPCFECLAFGPIADEDHVGLGKEGRRVDEIRHAFALDESPDIENRRRIAHRGMCRHLDRVRNHLDGDVTAGQRRHFSRSAGRDRDDAVRGSNRAPQKPSQDGDALVDPPQLDAIELHDDARPPA